ncbi:MAG: type II toxin-antitoxin system VapC family toxin [bacterium]|nr:type II toxin-antitoxin system VapC family toxin [bacterium]MDE0351380.1 type II toxin-antitoxin system VapC family toxin [bacterium]
MRLLVDSHVALWWLEGSPSLGPACRNSIERADQVFFSAVTPWELGIKKALGKVSFPDGLTDRLEAEGFEALSISPRHAEQAAALPPHHRDPFDRMLVAQAQLEALALVTADRVLHPYDVSMIEALE